MQSEAGLTPASAEQAGGVADREMHAGFISKQMGLGGATDRLPAGALAAPPREPVHELQPESDGPEVLMEPLRQHDPEERLRAIADAQAETDIAYAKAHAAAVKNHGKN